MSEECHHYEWDCIEEMLFVYQISVVIFAALRNRALHFCFFAGEQLHFAALAVELQAEEVLVVAEEEGSLIVGADLFVVLVQETLAEFVAEAVFCGHESFAFVI